MLYFNCADIGMTGAPSAIVPVKQYMHYYKPWELLYPYISFAYQAMILECDFIPVQLIAHTVLKYIY